MQSLSISDVLDAIKTLAASARLDDSVSDVRSILPPQIPPLPEAVSKLPKSPSSLEDVLSLLQTHVLPYLNASSLSSRYYGFVTGGVTPAALAADVLTSLYDQNVAVHLPHDTIATTVEVAALNMLLDLFSLDKDQWGVGINGGGGGVFTTGATASNVLGLALGREYVFGKASQRNQGEWRSVAKDGLLDVAAFAGVKNIKIFSTLPHSSIGKAAATVGIGRANLVSIGASGGLDIDIDVQSLKSMMATARRDNIVCILAVSVGEVNTGRFATHSLSTMVELRSICNEYDAWMHVDGAFGLFARILDGVREGSEFSSLVQGTMGLQLADSITGDGHKMLNVPYDCGFFFTRHKTLSEQVFTNGAAAYLSSGPDNDGIQSPLNIGIENSRRFRALPVYTSLLTYGRDGYVDMVAQQVRFARRIVDWIWDHPLYQLLPVESDKTIAMCNTFMIVLFRLRDQDGNRELVRRINATGKIYCSGTQWDGKAAARIAVSNWKVDMDRDFPIVQDVLSRVADTRSE